MITEENETEILQMVKSAKHSTACAFENVKTLMKYYQVVLEYFIASYFFAFAYYAYI